VRAQARVRGRVRRFAARALRTPQPGALAAQAVAAAPRPQGRAQELKVNDAANRARRAPDGQGPPPTARPRLPLAPPPQARDARAAAAGFACRNECTAHRK